MREVAHLIVAEKETGQIVAFMGVENVRLEMLFLAPEEIGKGSVISPYRMLVDRDSI